jgi:hypothetical protein
MALLAVTAATAHFSALVRFLARFFSLREVLAGFRTSPVVLKKALFFGVRMNMVGP